MFWCGIQCGNLYLPACIVTGTWHELCGCSFGGGGSFERVRVYMRAYMGMRACVRLLDEQIFVLQVDCNFFWEQFYLVKILERH